MVSRPDKQRILIVDDTRENIQILVEALSGEYKISVATNGEDALRIAASQQPPDLVLLDIVMPGLDGYEVCKRLKQDERTQKIPVIFITARIGVEDETHGLEIGAVDYITKPFSLPIVKARVKTHLELKHNRDLLEDIVHMDGLTGIRNRRYFDELLAIEWRRAERRAQPLSLILLDIDHFKDFNDNYGHTLGDDCLKQVAGTLADSVRRPADFVARYGGEEFAAVLPETDASAASLMGELMRKRVESLELTHAYCPNGRVTISLGVVTAIPRRELAPERLVVEADKLLYKAKKEGRNCMFCDEIASPRDRDTQPLDD